MPKYVDIEKAKEYVNLSNEAFISLKGFYIIPKDTPAADVAPVVHGRWQIIRWSKASCCSRCGIEFDFGNEAEFIFCPNCGAKMDGN